MSSEDESNAQLASKKRRLQGACDICRRKKIRCDSVQMPGNRCSECISFNLECTHHDPVQKRGPKRRYNEHLMSRLQNLEETIRTSAQIQPENGFPASTFTSGFQPNIISYGSLSTPSSKSTPSTNDLSDAQDEDDFAHSALGEAMEMLAIAPVSVNHLFFGPSSGHMLMQSAMGYKKQHTGDTRKTGTKRSTFWNTHSWERAAEAQEIPLYQFPEPELRDSLVTTFFSHVNLFLYVLHKPTFRRSINEGLHLRNPRFGALLLLVCAVASRYSNDPRVYLEGSNSTLSCGWKWFDQVQIIPKYTLDDAPRTYELQIYCLASLFFLGTTLLQASRTMTGLGIRLAQDLGVHRRKPDGYRLGFQAEMQKRAFWFLLSMDRLTSSFSGRSPAIREEDYDAEPPVECDDEYWDVDPDSVATFRHPPGKPSRIACFNCMIQLGEILARALRDLYAIKKSKDLLGLLGDDVEQRLVAELDSALNNWVDSVPSHLRWDPRMENLAYFNQSAVLYSLFYTVQIQIHRPFIDKPSPLTFSSLAICANAARSCSHVLDAHVRRGVITLPHSIISAFTAGLVLLMNVWRKQPGLSSNLSKELADVEKCMNLLHATEHRWTLSGRLWDALRELASHDEVIIPQHDENASSMRQRNTGMTNPVPSASMTANQPAFDPVAQEMSSMANPSFDISSESWNLDSEVLPMYSSELSRLPIYAGGLPSTSLPSTSNHAQHPHVTADALQMSNVSGNPLDGLPTPDTLSSFDTLGCSQLDYSALANRDTTLQAFPDTLDIWSSAPAGFSFEEWGQYIASFEDNDLFPSSAPAT